MCRYDDASGLRWRNIRFVEDGSGFEITFEKRKNAKYRKGNKVMVASMGLWFSGVLGTSVALFKKHWATQSGRSGSASAAANAGIPAELWGQHGDWLSMAA
jgi:hypothetical protein